MRCGQVVSVTGYSAGSEDESKYYRAQ